MFTLPKASIDKCGLLAPIDIHLPLGCIMVVVSLSARWRRLAACGRCAVGAALRGRPALWPGVGRAADQVGRRLPVLSSCACTCLAEAGLGWRPPRASSGTLAYDTLRGALAREGENERRPLTWCRLFRILVCFCFCVCSLNLKPTVPKNGTFFLLLNNKPTVPAFLF